MQRYRCEDLCASDRIEEAKEALVNILDASDEEIYMSDWVTGGY